MNGFIEIYVDGWRRFRWLFTLKDYDGFSFKQQVELREADLKKIIDAVKENVVPVFDPARIEIQIAYESKMNFNYEETESERADRCPDALHRPQLETENTPANGGTFENK